MLSVQDEVFSEFGNMDQTQIQHKMQMETTLENTRAKDARIFTAIEVDDFSWYSLERI